jgi:hypothetical protein
LHLFGQHKEVSDILGPEVDQQDLIRNYEFDSMLVDSTYSNQNLRPEALKQFDAVETRLTINEKGKKIEWKLRDTVLRFYFINVTETEEKYIYQVVDEKTGESWYVQLDRQQKRAILFSPASNIRYTLR